MSDKTERDEKLESLLADLRIQPIANDGFSERVMASLPARRQPHRILLIGAAVIGALLATWQLSEAELLHTAMREIQIGNVGLASIILLATLTTLISGLAGWAIAEGEA